MTSEQLKEKIEKKQAELKDLQKQIKEAEQAKKKTEELNGKLEAMKSEITQAVQAMFEKSGISLPDSKQIVITMTESGFITNMIETKTEREHTGNGGAKNITFEGNQISWAKLCDLKGIARTPSGSAHRDVYNKAKELHDSISHTCVYDGKTYPIAQG